MGTRSAEKPGAKIGFKVFGGFRRTTSTYDVPKKEQSPIFTATASSTDSIDSYERGTW